MAVSWICFETRTKSVGPTIGKASSHSYCLFDTICDAMIYVSKICENFQTNTILEKSNELRKKCNFSCVLQVNKWLKWMTLAEFELLHYHRMSLETDLFHSFGYHEPSSSEDFPLFLGTARWETATWFNHNIIFQDSNLKLSTNISCAIWRQNVQIRVGRSTGRRQRFECEDHPWCSQHGREYPRSLLLGFKKNRWRSYRVFATAND